GGGEVREAPRFGATAGGPGQLAGRGVDVQELPPTPFRAAAQSPVGDEIHSRGGQEDQHGTGRGKESRLIDSLARDEKHRLRASDESAICNGTVAISMRYRNVDDVPGVDSSCKFARNSQRRRCEMLPARCEQRKESCPRTSFETWVARPRGS